MKHRTQQCALQRCGVLWISDEKICETKRKAIGGAGWGDPEVSKANTTQILNGGE
jgi:hypothetical protein